LPIKILSLSVKKSRLGYRTTRINTLQIPTEKVLQSQGYKAWIETFDKATHGSDVAKMGGADTPLAKTGADFADVLATVDEVYILPIYKARLEDTVGINEDIVVDAINSRGGHAKKLATLSDIPVV
jgi:hypothetical protein